MLRVVAPLLATLFIADYCRASEPDQTSDKAKIQGIWKCVEAIIDGDKSPDAVGTLMIIKGKQATWRLADGFETKATFRIDESTTPKQIIWTYPLEGEQTKPDVLFEIYKLCGDTITTCGGENNKTPPKGFKSPKGSGLGLATYQKLANGKSGIQQ
jgi:uncharacterized protein (TIGR03067 family)